MAFVIGDYQYTTVTSSSYGTGWHCKVVDTSKSSYQAIPSSFTHDGSTYQVVSLNECFKGCTNLTVSPSLPSGVKDLDSCFYGCTSLTTAPSIPSGVVSMSSCFYSCTALTTAPSIPASVTGIGAMSNCFYGCTSLTTPPTMPASFTNTVTMYRCFYGCTSLTTAPSIPSGVTSMSSCFYSCTALTTAPAIPASVTTLEQCFSGCTSLATPPTMPASFTNTVNMYGCFYNCKLLTTPPSIPNGVTSMANCFDGCSALTTAPSIPNSVTNMSKCFHYCSALESAPSEIPASVTNMTECFYGCISLTTPPTIQNGVERMEGSFRNCRSLLTAPVIPASVTLLRNCFLTCDSLAGNITVYNTITSSFSYDGVFLGTKEDIYIINGAGTSAVETAWQTIASGYSNVHYEADDNPSPSLSFTATRVNSSSSETPSESGTYAFIKATVIVYDTYLPGGWTITYPHNESESLTMNGVAQSPSWTRNNVGNVYTLKTWLSPIDASKNTFTLQVSDLVKNDNNVLKATKLSEVVSQFIPKAYKLVDYYHDPSTDTEGMAIGKFATSADLFDVDMPTIFRDTTTCQDMTQTEIDNFVNGLDITTENAVDYIVEQGTNNGWQYRKWNSGIYEAWRKSENYFNMATQSGTDQYYISDFYTLPSNVTQINYLNCNRLTGGQGLVTTSIYSVDFTNSRFNFFIWNNGVSYSATFTVCMEIKGRWK